MQEYETFNASDYENEDESQFQPGFSEKTKKKVSVFNDEGFGIHFRVYFIIVGCLLALDYFTGPNLINWAHYVALGWGVGLSCHFWVTYLTLHHPNSRKFPLWIHGATMGTLIIFFLILDYLTSPALDWWLYPSIPLGITWLLHRATVFTPNKEK